MNTYSLRYQFEGPGDGTSPVTNSSLSAIDKAVMNGIVWINSAGNYGDRRTWSAFDVQTVTDTKPGRYGPVPIATWVDFDSGSGIDTYNRVQSRAGPNNAFLATVEIRWFGGGELELFRYNATDGSKLMLDGKRPYGMGEPVKILYAFDVDSDIRIKIIGDKPDWIQMMVHGGGVLEHHTRKGGVNTPSDSANPGMLAVGAVDVTKNRNIPPYSSQGQHPIHNSVRYKPDVYGSSHVTTDAYWNLLPSRYYRQSVFDGASAGTAHVSGIAALVLDYHNNTLSPRQTVEYIRTHVNERQVVSLPALATNPTTTTPHTNPFQQTVIETKHDTIHLGRASNVYTIAVRWNVDTAYWIATSANTTVASIDAPNSLVPMRGIFNPVVWFDNVIVHPHNPGTTTIMVNITDGTVHQHTSFDVTVTNNTHPAIHSIGTQHLDLAGTPHTIEFSAYNNDMDPLDWVYVLADHTYFDIHTPKDCKTKGPFEECKLPANTLTLTPKTAGDNAILYGVYDQRGGNDIDGVDVYVAPNTSPVHGILSALTIKTGESVTVQFNATDADGDVIIHLIPHTAHREIAESTRPYHTSNQELLEVASITPAPGLIAEGASFDENGKVISMSVLKETASGKMLRYVVNGTGGLPSIPESVISTYHYERSSTPTNANLTLSLTGLSPGNTTITSIVRDVWGGFDTQKLAVTVLPSNDPPVANAGSNQTVHRLHAVTLNASAYDPENDTLSYMWNQTGGTAVILSDDMVPNPTFTAPDSIDVLTFQISISDRYHTDTATVTITVVNRPPVADAGEDRTVRFGDVVTLAGSATDPDNDTLSYRWNQTSGLAVTLSNNTSPHSTFTAPINNTAMTFEVTVSDGIDSDTDVVTIYTIRPNKPPMVNAGADRSVGLGSVVVLNASATDPDNDTLSYVWRQTSGIKVVLLDDMIQNPVFRSPHNTTTLEFEVTVSDGMDSDSDIVSIRVENQPPIADAGAEQTVYRAHMVKLAGSATDPDGDIVSYWWNQTGGAAVVLSDDTASNPTFTSPDGAGDLMFDLTVSDGKHSDVDMVTIHVINRAPVARAGPDLSAQSGQSITLDGIASSDPDGDVISYSWSAGAGPRVQLHNATSHNTTFTTPDGPLILGILLTVSDGHQSSHDLVVIEVAAPSNRPPMVDAGSDRTVGYGKTITLKGSASDKDGDTLSYMWNQTGGTVVVLSDSMVSNPTFMTPAGMATLTFNLTVSDGYLSHTDTTTIHVVNNPPMVDAGSDRTVGYGKTTALKGSASDKDGDTLSYMWNQTGGTVVVLSDSMVSNPTFMTPAGMATLTFNLTVSDGYLSHTDTTTIHVVNNPPMVDAGSDQTVRFGDVVTLAGSATDPDNDTIVYWWNQTSGDVVSLSNNRALHPTFTAPDQTSTLVFNLTVSDSEYSIADTVTYKVLPPNRAPSANAGPDLTAGANDTIVLSGTASTDPDNDALTYAWSVLIGSSDILSNMTGPSVTVTVPGGVELLAIRLIVSDGQYTSQDVVLITIQ